MCLPVLTSFDGLPSVLTVTAAAPGYSAVLLTLLAGWDASPRDIRAAMAWGIISAARDTHLQAGTLGLSHCLGWSTAGESGVLAVGKKMLPAHLYQQLDPSSTSIPTSSMQQPHAVHACSPDCPSTQWLPSSLSVLQLSSPSLQVEAAWCLCAPPVHSSNPDHRRMCPAAGLVLIVLPHLPPVKALIDSLSTNFQDPDYNSPLPVMTCVACMSDALLLAALFYTLPFLLVTSTSGPTCLLTPPGPPQVSSCPLTHAAAAVLALGLLLIACLLLTGLIRGLSLTAVHCDSLAASPL